LLAALPQLQKINLSGGDITDFPTTPKASVLP
jgi:hypothetical protein